MVQASGNHHHRVADGVLPVAERVLNKATALYAPNRVFNAHFLARNPAIFFRLFDCEGTTAWFLCWLLDRYVYDREALKAHILMQYAADR